MASPEEIEKMKLELFKAILSNPSNQISGLDANKAIEVVDRVMDFISDPKSIIKIKSKA